MYNQNNMKDKLPVSLIQIHGGTDPEPFIQTACDSGAKFILLPEVFNSQTEKEPLDGPSIKNLQKIAKKKKVCILAGSIREKIDSETKAYNASVVIDESGKIADVYRKIHLFDVDLPERKMRESSKILAGAKPILSKVFGITTGLSVCYDLRFPELYRLYSKKGAEMLCVPSCFTYVTGKDHWEVLLRARAIENQCFVLAPNQIGKNADGILSYGNSMIIDPWGNILARGSLDREEIVSATLDFGLLAKTRTKFPALSHRKLK